MNFQTQRSGVPGPRPVPAAPVCRHYPPSRKKEVKRAPNGLEWNNLEATYVCCAHLAGVLGFLLLWCAKWQTLLWAFCLWPISGFGVTAGSHRLWAHRSYKARLPLRIVLMVCNSMANQGSILDWAQIHRAHHRFSDTVADPHDSRKGFFHCHIGWLVTKAPWTVIDAVRSVDVSDLEADPVIMWQMRREPWWNMLCCFLFPAVVSKFWGEYFILGFLIPGALRYIWVLHCTCCVNSFVHWLGAKPYDRAHCSTDRGWVAFLALGEGWHNWHHAFPFDYATSELGSLQQWNPTKVLLDVLALFGLVYDRKRATKMWDARKKQWSEGCGAEIVESLEGLPLFRTRKVEVGPRYDTDHDVDEPLGDLGGADTAFEASQRRVKIPRSSAFTVSL